MTELTGGVFETARQSGADLVGVASAADLPEHAQAIERIVPGARSIVVVIARHSLSALNARTNEVRQFDTIHTYGQCEHAAHGAARYLEDQGFAAAAVPAFIPLDMGERKKGMRGEINWRQAGYLAGLGSWGENGLLVTPEYGSAIRLCGVVTDAELTPGQIRLDDACDHCLTCVEACPVGAQMGGGRIDKKKCGDYIFRYGFRAFQGFMTDLAEARNNEAGKDRALSVIKGPALRELWQNFMTGNYYYCFRCQDRCHKTPNDTSPPVRMKS